MSSAWKGTLAILAVLIDGRAVPAADLVSCRSDTRPELAISACSADIKTAADARVLALAYYSRGVAYWRNNELDRAAADLSSAIQLRPNLIAALTVRGLVHEQKGDHDRARADFNAALTRLVNPANSAADQWAHSTARERLAKLPSTVASPASTATTGMAASAGPATTSSVRPEKPLTQAIGACNAKAVEPVALPSMQGGDLKLSQCFRGRAHYVCVATALLAEANAMKREYAAVIEADYPNKKDWQAVCSLAPDRLADHFTKIKTFDERLKVLKKGYEELSSCTNQVDDALGKVNLANMAQGADILKSLRESIRAEVNKISTAQRSVLNLAGNLASAGRAMVTIEKLQKGGLCH